MRRVLPVLLAVAVVLASIPRDASAASALSPAQIKELMTSPMRQVRTSETRIGGLLAEGLRRSTTFADLFYAIHRTDLIVYVESSMVLPTTLAGRVLLSSSQHGQRYETSSAGILPPSGPAAR